jgi:eukaryotic-like serine/threonine-protein kinase
MSLGSGTRLGPYEIVGTLGAGGMGEVYRARDTKLNRNVAIKVLLPAVASDPDRLARFSREAQVLASLNHPNIAHIHGLEESGGVQALVMELVEGPTLADHIAGSSGPMPVREVLSIAKQIAEALEAAHEQGIIHRDLKPANIKVRPDGRVKVLDFGLAKALAPAGAGDTTDARATMSPTLSMRATQAGIILGTAAYMSPEQAAGKPVDKRSDLWAFGVVLLEMLTGRQVFGGETTSHVLASVLKDEPDWTALPADTPAPLRRLLRRCLQKDRKRRLADAADAWLEIDEAETSPTDAPLPLDASSARGRLGWVVAAASSAAMLALGFPAVRYFRQAPPVVGSEMRTEINTPASTDPLSFALSPDGKQLVFVASGDGAPRLWLRPLATTSAQPLAGTEGADYPFWSPDSRSVGFFADGKLKRLDIGGGSPQVLADTNGPRGGTWNADGVILFAPSFTSPIFRVPSSGGKATPATTLGGVQSHRFPQFLPDGRRFLFYAQGTPDTGGIYLGSLDTPDARRLTAADAAGAYAQLGWLLWVRAGTLMAQRLDMERRALTGDPVTVADVVAIDATTYASALSVSASGLLAYRTATTNRRQLNWFDRTGKALGTLGAPDESNLWNPRVSPDGRRAAVNRTVQGNADVWLLDGTRSSRFTFDAALDRFPVWSPDGSRIVFDSTRTGATRNLYVKASGGAGNEDLLVESPQSKVAGDWSADGRFLLYMSIDPQTDADMWVVPLEGDRKPWVFLKTNFTEYSGVFSPDGRWIAYQSNESGRFEIYVRPFVPPSAANAPANSAAGQWQVSTAGGISPRWRADGKELYYIGQAGQMMAASITVMGTSLAPGAPVKLFDTRIYGGGVDNRLGTQYDVARDGRFLIDTVLDEATAPITLLQNWTPPATK